MFQQIVGRGLRLCDGKTDCLVLDYGQRRTPLDGAIYSRQKSQRIRPIIVENGLFALFVMLLIHSQLGQILEKLGMNGQCYFVDLAGQQINLPDAQW